MKICVNMSLTYVCIYMYMVGSKAVLTSFYLYSFRAACLRSPMFYNILILFKMYYNYLGVRMVKLFQLEKFDFDNFELTHVAPVALEETRIF